MAHCSYDEPGGDEPYYGHFDYLVDADGPDEVKDLLRAKLRRARKRFGLLSGGVRVYLDDLIEIHRLPKRGLIGRYLEFLGHRGEAAAMPMAATPSAYCVLLESGVLDGDDDPGGDESDDGVMVEPFMVFGPKRRR